MKFLSPVLLVCRSESFNFLGLHCLRIIGLRRVMATVQEGKELNRLISALSPALIIIDANFYWESTPRRIGLLLRDRPELNIAVCNFNTVQPERLVDFLRFGARSVIDFNYGVGKFRRGITQTIHNQAYTSGNVQDAYDDLPDNKPELRVYTTAREDDVKRLMWKCRNSKEIALILGMGVKTVETHKTALFANYGVANVSEFNRQCLLLGEMGKDDV
ncbi:hypothetical protein AGMMS49944_25340 [Spirochaetia bacterium]|nr:hypothetical protein AGMMS49944_25340 [Spirochaetia bacterium]